LAAGTTLSTGTARTTAAMFALSARAALARTRRAGILKDLLLLGSQDLIQLGLCLLCEFFKLFPLIVGQVQLVDHKGRK
jgi:hypothetical protein